MKLLKCLIYLAVVGVASFLFGRILPTEWFLYNRFPYRSFAFEKNGALYRRMGVPDWKEKLPDMSVIFPNWMPSKKIPKDMDVKQAKLMIQETCIAELIHGLLGMAGFGCLFIWRGIGGVVISVVYLLGNLPYVLIQRYNRPKLVNILHLLEKRTAENRKNEENIYEECSDIKLQYGTGT